MDGQLQSKECVAVRMVEHGIFEAFEGVRLSDNTYDIWHVVRMTTWKDIFGV